jgi:hypothetical protein
VAHPVTQLPPPMFRSTLHNFGYAPQIMYVIEKVTGNDFLKDKEITYLKPQNSTAHVITMDVPSTSAAPHSTRSGAAAPPPAASSSSSGGILRALKHIFAWCRDTHECQDVILNNQRHQNEYMGLTDFNEFPLTDPPLVDDPFASLSTTDIVAMEAAPDAEASDSEYEEDEEGKGDDDDKSSLL